MTKARLINVLLGFGVFFILAAGIMHMGHIDTNQKTCSQTSVPGIVREVETNNSDARPIMNIFTKGMIVYK